MFKILRVEKDIVIVREQLIEENSKYKMFQV